ncbi:acyltransferase [Croceivirga sp. JEA036]|uniref:acyltransferase n=1 Tax=Croceivirga sp. JEA036 TaxID=2721162 RepID=UPI001438B736|nr:acyltransferase [Croceivirga sp. JEA036]NJB35398.1 acyltransferase [Croceivirga sp. JEA036]
MIKKLVKKARFWYLTRIKWRRYQFGPNFYAGLRVSLWAKDTLTIGRNFYIGRDSQIETDCVIGDNVIFGNCVAIVGKYDHHFQQIGYPIRLASRIRDDHYDWKGKGQLTRIEDDVWVGYGSIIMSGVTLAKGCIIAAGAVVTRDTEPYSIYGGNPAKKIANRFNSLQDLQTHEQKEKELQHLFNAYTGIQGLAIKKETHGTH